MGFGDLKERVWKANMALRESGLIVLTWGNASEIDRDAGVVAIKPSGVPYEELSPDDIVILNLEDGSVVEGALNPSSDTPTHLVLYRALQTIGGVVHTHSPFATGWAQAGKPIPCLGTTHADSFYGIIPVARQLSPVEIEEAYEECTGKVIVEYFEETGTDPLATPAVLLPYHGPFAWGASADKAATNAVILEEVAKIACYTQAINPDIVPAPQTLLEKHYFRKHGPGAYYGQEHAKGDR